MTTTLHGKPCGLLGVVCPKASRCLHKGRLPKPISKVQGPVCSFSSWSGLRRRQVWSSPLNLNLPGCTSMNGFSGTHPGAHSNPLKQLGRKPLHSFQPRSALSDTAQKHPAASSQADSSVSRLAYEVRVETSRAAGSGLSQPEGGVMIALIGTEGKFDLKTLDTGSGDGQASGTFDVGGTVETHFQGASIGGIRSILLSPATGTWRPARASVLVRQAGSEQSSQLKSGVATSERLDPQNDAFQVEEEQDSHSYVTGLASAENGEDVDTRTTSPVLYTFVWNEGLIGEGCDESAAELFAKTVHTGGDASQMLGTTSKPVDLVALRASGLAEYEELKFFLLGCTAALVGVGTLGSKLSFGDDVSIGFALGGAAGLLYLLLLERTVDQIGDTGEGFQEASVASEKAESLGSEVSGGPFDRILNRVAMIAKGPASRLLLVALLGLAGAKAVGGSELKSLEPRQILGGLVGFLVYKVAVILAAFRPAKLFSRD